MKKILVSALLNLGDVIMLSSALDLIKKNYPEIKIDILARKDSLSILENNPLINEIILYPYKSGSFFYGLKDTIKKIKNNNYNLYISLDRRPRSALVCFLSQIKKRIGPNRLFTGSKKTIWTKIFYHKNINISEENSKEDNVLLFQKIVKESFLHCQMPLNGLGEIVLPPISTNANNKAKKILKKAHKPIIGFCVKTHFTQKTWAMENFIQLMEKIYKNYNAYFYISGTKEERKYVQKLIDKLSCPCINLAGETSLQELAAITNLTQIYVTLDNGAAHIVSNSCDTKIICIMFNLPKKIKSSLKKAEIVCAQNEDSSEENFEIDTINPNRIYEIIKKNLTEIKVNA